jgi:hypothetical protein
VQSAALEDGRLVLPVTKDAVRSAPEVGEGGHLSPDDEARLRRHYGLEVAGTGEPAWTADSTGLTPAGAAPAEDEHEDGHEDENVNGEAHRGPMISTRALE